VIEVQELSRAIDTLELALSNFMRYVPNALVRGIISRTFSSELGGKRQPITVLFTDVAGFTPIAEALDPEEVMAKTSRYFSDIGGELVRSNATIDKYIGDSIMAFWNAPEPDPDHIVNACRAALQAAAAGRLLSEKWRQLGRPGFRTRFGLHTGLAVVGNVGAREHINYTLVGAVANQASRMEGLNKMYHTEILATGEVARAAADYFVWRQIDRIVAAGTTEEHDIHEPMGEVDAAGQHAEFLAQWRVGREAYSAGRFEAALAAFRAAAILRPDDGPCRVFIARCMDFLRDGPPEGWNGTWHFDSK
jgi:adenylate cyclase